MFRFLTIIACLATINVSAQSLPLQWAKTFTAQGRISDRIAAMTTDAAGNIYVAGYAGAHHGAADAFAMKRNLQGDTLWTYYYDGGGNNEDYANDIFVDAAGNTYITGRSQTAVYRYDCFTVKISPTGTQVWATRYYPGSNSESYGNAIVADASGNVYVAGYVDPTSGSNDWLVLKYNSSGVQQWVDVLNGPGNGGDEAWDIAMAPNGNITVCGFAYSINASGNTNAFIKQYTPANGTVWTDTWTNPVFTGVDKFFGLGYSAAGDLYAGGDTRNAISSNQDMFAIKYDASGGRVWTHIYVDATTTADEYIRGVKVDDAGNVFFTGTDYNDGVTTCILNNGTNGWRKKWKGTVSNGKEVFHGITTDNADGIYVTGRGIWPGPDYYGNGGLTNMIITKYNTAGDSLWTYRCQDSLNASMGFAITHRNGKIYAGGFVTDTAYINENLYTIIVDTAGNAIKEWSFNGKGDALTHGQFVRTDANNNVYCAATVDRLYGEGYDVAIVKYSPIGNLLWERYYTSGGWRNDTLTAMQFDLAGNLILSISTDSAKQKNNYRLSLLKIDQNGNFLDTAWYAGTGSTLTKSMVIRNDNSIAIAASSSNNGGLLVYFDDAFNFSWVTKIDSTVGAVTRANSVDVFPNGDLLVGGYFSSGGVITGLVQRYDSTGLKLWSTSVDSVGTSDEVKDATVNAAGDVAFTGSTGAIILAGKISGTTGNIIWRSTYNPTSTTSEFGVKVKFTPAGNVVLISRGWTGFVARYYTVQFTNNGVFQWVAVYSQTASDREPLKLIVESTNRVVTAGWATNGTTTNYDYVLTGYNSLGGVDFVNTYTTSSNTNWDQLFDINRDSQGNFIVTGRTASEFYNEYLFKMLTIKYGGVIVGQEEISDVVRNFALVYPNPSNDGRFTLIDASQDRVTSAKVYDMMGRFIVAVDASSEHIDLSSQKAGVYILVLERENARPEQVRLLKQ